VLAAVRMLARAALRHGPVFNKRIDRLGALLPKRLGKLSTAVFLLATIGYGAFAGDHIATATAALKEARDAAANKSGFRITNLTVAGRKQLSEEEVLSAAGFTPNASLLFLDVTAVRRSLEAAPRVARATVRKFYPGSLEITVEEREPFAIWQLSGKLSVIADDGTVLGPFLPRMSPALPLIVGPGAAVRANEFLAVLARYPQLREQVRASVFVAERRWNLKFKSGLDVRLPETDVPRALDALVQLDRERNILSRDVTAVDLRLPERTTVRLSDEAAQAREQQIAKDKKNKAKGGNA
jgi:cell division protein FtsQ